jgi:uncharacterized protein (TIGR03382 family)
VKGAGIDFAIIRVSDGANYNDSKFAANWQGAKDAGVIRGVYQFFRPGQDPIAQADLLINKVGVLGPDDLPAVIDVEATDGQSAATIAANVGIWLERVKAGTGKTPIIYTGKYFWNDNVQTTAYNGYPLWVAQYGPVCPDLPTAWSDWTMFQYSSTGSVAGISGNVDTDKFNGDLNALMAFARGTTVCGDGLCTGDETHDTCPGDCPTCDPIPGDGRVIDDSEVCTEIGGPAAYIRTANDGWGGELKWTHTTDDATEANFATWHLEFVEAGRYRVEAYTPASFAQSKQAAYVVHHAGADDTTVVDTTAVDGWTLIGDFDFAAGADQYIHVGDNTGEPVANNVQLVFDAVRVTRLDANGNPVTGDPNVDPSNPDGSFTMTGSGCSTSGHGGGSVAWLLALALVPLVRRRGR